MEENKGYGFRACTIPRQIGCGSGWRCLAAGSGPSSLFLALAA